MGENRNAYRILVGKPEGKRPLGRPRRRWVNNIKMDIRETGLDGMGWIGLAQDRGQWRALVNMGMNLQVLKNVRKFLSSYTIGGFSGRAQLHESVSDGHSNCSRRTHRTVMCHHVWHLEFDLL
jgi:hypothetical protein